MTDTDTLIGLLRAVCLDPEDVDVRLVYADALEEAGQEERAELIRVQIRINAINTELQSEEDCGGSCCEERRRLRRREQALLDYYDQEWTQQIWPAPLGWSLSRKQAVGGRLEAWDWRFRFRRGFAEEASLPCASWLVHGPTLVCQTPLRVVRLMDAGTERIGNRDPDISFWRIILPRPEFVNPFHLIMGWHRTEAEAWRDLSDQVLEWARREAGLPSTDNPQSTGS